MSTETITFGEEHDTLGKRLKHARETRRLTRKELAAMTGIGYKTIENYEYEKADAKTSVVDALAEALGVFGAILQYGPLPELERSQVASEASTVLEFSEPTRIENTQNLLAEIEELRHDGFTNTPRLSIALVEDLRNSFRYLEIEEIGEVAQSAGLDNLDDLDSYAPALAAPEPRQNPYVFSASDDPEEKPDALEAVLERVMDTAIIGNDMHALSLDRLKEVARESEVSGPFFGWEDAEQIIAALRPVLRLNALTAHEPLDLEV